MSKTPLASDINYSKFIIDFILGYKCKLYSAIHDIKFNLDLNKCYKLEETRTLTAEQLCSKLIL